MSNGMRPLIDLDSVRIEWERDGVNTDSCQAVATVSYQIPGSADRRLETLTSGGLGGITLDERKGQTDPYRYEVEREQIEDLRDHLAIFGVLDPKGIIGKLLAGNNAVSGGRFFRERTK